MGKVGYATCTNCGCNEPSIEIYRCQSCNKMVCQKCGEHHTFFPDSKCETSNLKHIGYIERYDEVYKAL